MAFLPIAAARRLECWWHSRGTDLAGLYVDNLVRGYKVWRSCRSLVVAWQAFVAPPHQSVGETWPSCGSCAPQLSPGMLTYFLSG